MARSCKLVGALLIVLVMCVAAAWGDEKDPRVVAPVPPLPAGESSSRSAVEGDDALIQNQKSLDPDTRPVTGAQQLTLGSFGTRRNLLLTSLHFLQFADSNPGTAPGTSRWDSSSTINGRLGLLHYFGQQSVLSMNYAGGGTLYRSGGSLNGSFHQLSLSYEALWRRWSFLLADLASYLPESSFGYGGFGGLNGFGAGSGGSGLGQSSLGGLFPTLNPAFYPNQGILTGSTRRISNAVVGEARYSFSPRSSLTLSGSYGLLHFLDPGFVDSKQGLLRIGYNHDLDRRNTIGFFYGYSRFRFNSSSNLVENHSVHLAYGRRITGRLAVRLDAGPNIKRFPDSSVATSSIQRISWGMGSWLSYSRARENFSVSYHHGITGGAGVLQGAQSDFVQAAVNRQLNRNWSGELVLGYSRNESLHETVLSTQDAQYNSWNTGLRMRRMMGRHMYWTFSYNLQRQTSNASLCTTGGCGTAFLRHQFGLGVDWDFRPIRLE